FLEGVDLVHGDDAIGLGHLGAERDHTDGEGHLVLGWAVLFLVAIDDVMAGDAAEERADRASNREPRRGTCELAPNRHVELPQTALLWLEHKDFCRRPHAKN